MPSRATRKNQEHRLRLAQAAARLMAEDGVLGFAHARRKAAERLGISNSRHLPSNSEIEQALQEYQRLFQADSQQQHLQTARLTALQAMRFLHAFSPRLTGPVLSGTATRHNPICLHLFSDNPKAVEVFLLDSHIPHEGSERRLNFGAITNYPLLRFMAGELTVELVILPCKHLHQLPISPVDGRPQKRADLTQLETLLASQMDGAQR